MTQDRPEYAVVWPTVVTVLFALFVIAVAVLEVTL